MMDVYLHGPLGKRYGGKHRFDVRTPREAASALDANFEGFAAQFAKTQRWQIVVDGDALTGEVRNGDEAAIYPASSEIHFYPAVDGQASLGGLLIGALIPALAGTATASILGGILFAGVALGLSYLLKPKPQEQQDEGDKRENNYAFSGPENVAQQGVPVPLIYGRNFVGSVVISAGISTDNPVVDTTGSGQGGEIKDNMASVQTARIIDLLGEGQIKGVVDAHKGVYLDNVALMAPNGTLNFPTATAQFRVGTRSQSRMANFPYIESEFDVGVQLEYGKYEVRAVDNPDVDQVRFTIQIPQLQDVDKESGVIAGATVVFRVQYNFENAGWTTLWDTSISGKTGSPWYYNRIFVFPANTRGSWQFRLTRLTPTSKDNVSDDVYWSAYTERIDDRVNYAHSALVGLSFDAHDFSAMPKRIYDVEGLLILVPTNYDPDDGSYDETTPWDGSFKIAYSNNPAWCLFDLITKNRYGLGDFCPVGLNDRWSFYKAGKWCDQRVLSAGPGSTLERRYVCNVVINTQREAFDLLGQVGSVFRGFTYWSGGQLVAVADQPEDPVAQFTNANVVDGSFTYSGSDIRQRHTQILVGWYDRDLLGQGRVAIVEDQDAVSAYGIQPMTVDGFGNTSESQAIRAGKWELYTQEFEGDTVQCVAGLEAAYLKPGAIFKVMDVNVAGRRRGGRVGAGSTPSRIVLDGPVALAPTQENYISCLIETPTANVIQTRLITDFTPGQTTYVECQAFGGTPHSDTVFIISAIDRLEPTLWRAMNVRQQDVDRYEVEGVRHFPQKWDYVEKNKAFSEPDISDISPIPPPVLNLRLTETIVLLSAISVGVAGTLSWTSNATRFEVVYRQRGQNWRRVSTDQHQLVDLALTKGTWDFEVTPISGLGIRGTKATLTANVVGLSAPPATPTNFRVQLIEGIALFGWRAATELDVIIGGHYELRFSSKTSGALWNTAQPVLTSIPGSATSVEANYQTGSWLLRVFDGSGNPSPSWATILAFDPDTRYSFYERRCESPDFLGSRQNVEVLLPQQWLVIGASGGLWDDQLDPMDDWPDVDVLPEPPGPIPAPRHGEYTFFDRFDLGAPFSIRLTADLLAFPFFIDGDFIDSRMTNADDWVDWDDQSEDLDAQVTLQMRTTNLDPASADPGWSEWQQFVAGEHFARAFEFRAFLDAPSGQNIGIETLCIIADIRAKADEGADVIYAATPKTVTFNIKFYRVPAVVITVQEALATDQIQITAKDREKFTVNITNAGAQVTRTLDWHAQGY